MQNDFADALDANVGAAQQVLERGPHAVEVAGDRDVETGDLPAFAEYLPKLHNAAGAKLSALLRENKLRDETSVG